MAHLKVSNSVLNLIAGRAILQFDVAWEEAWKNEINCDGVWLFAKFQVGQKAWGHVTLAAASPKEFDYTDQTPPGFSKGVGGASAEMGVWVPETRKGAFIFRTQGEGPAAAQSVQLAWDFKQDGLQAEALEQTQIRIFGLEMVYVAQAKHFIGDPVGEKGPLNCFYTYPDQGAYLIESEAPITVDAKAGCLYCDQDNDRSRDAVPFVIPAAFPKGYKPFWLMKYGLSSQQYVDFLNTLTRRQQQGRVLSDISADEVKNYYVMTNTDVEKLRQSIVCPKKGNGIDPPITFYTYAPARACNAISWGDVAAFAAWAALRPITELEFEKACRGPEKAIPSELAWGTLDIGRVDMFSGPDGSGYEIKVPTTGVVNCCYGGSIAPFKAAQGQTVPDNPGFEGPVSCGLFANTRHRGVPKRVNDGAGYYGALELTGNLWEPCVTVGHPVGRAYIPHPGSGYLDEKGDAQEEGWPDATGAGTGVRGGVYRSPDQNYLVMALRFAANHAKSAERYNGGCRVGF